MNECVAKDIGGYLCMDNLHALIAAWLNASQTSQDDVSLNISAKQ